MSLESRLSALAERSSDSGAWCPVLFDLRREDDVRTLEALLDAGQVAAIHDRIHDQLGELITTRRPGRRPQGAELDELIRAELAGSPLEEYGTWVFYPWSKRLVHVLPEPAYRALRSSRNRYKITPAEQAELRSKKIGVVGLSVGQASAVTLALEGVGGSYCLADFDELALSNMNRLRTPVYNIGINKCVIAAREMFEIDPYLKIEIFPRGLTEENCDEFLTAGGKLDLVVEECDDLYIKLLVRERARAHRIPVIMETNDRGMLDVERFDLEPDRPILHGLLKGLSPAGLKARGAREKVPVLLRILGEGALRGRLAASMLEVDETTTSWPQLASGTMLGGAIATDVARRIILGDLKASGRYFVDLEQILKDGQATEIAVDTTLDQTLVRWPLAGPVAPPLLRAVQDITAEDVRRVVGHGILAPSGGNAQPWKFVAKGPKIRCLVDPERGRELTDYERMASYVAVGAAVENMVIAGQAMGMRVDVKPFPDARDELVAADVHLNIEREDRPPPRLASQIARRMTNRKVGTRMEIPEAQLEAMRQAADEAGARLQIVTDPDALETVGGILGKSDRLSLLTQQINAEMASEIRWSEDSVLRTRDGIDVLTLELNAVDLFGVWLSSNWPSVEFLAKLGGGKAFERMAKRSIAGSSAVGLLTVPGKASPDSYFRGGRALERVWLTATQYNLALHPVSAMVYLFARIERGGGHHLGKRVVEGYWRLRVRYLRIFNVSPGEAEILLFRLSVADPPTARSLRRPLEEVLSFEGQ
jgi:molybdopterin/thiamine biosynthesis adenylyltransferase